MKISLFKPKIIRGNMNHKVKESQNLINGSRRDLLVLPEYGLTGLLVLDSNANINEWYEKSEIV